MPINIIPQNRLVKPPSRRLKKALQRISTILGQDELEINFQLVSDRQILSFNRRYLSHDHVTDVISFLMEEKGVLGDIVISVDTAKRQAKEEGHDLLTELKILAIHGLLHLLGYRDKTKLEQKRMWKKTDELLAQVKDL